MIEIRLTATFSRWLERLKDRKARERIIARLRRFEIENFGDVKPVGNGVSEARFDYGPGYRRYFVNQGNVVVIMLCGGDKSSQRRDIETAKAMERSYDMPLKTTRFDIQDYIKTPKDQAGYLEAALEDGDPALVAAAIGDIARARGATQFARDSGLSRETIYKVFRPGGNPTLETMAKAVKVLGLRLTLARAPK